MNRINNFIELTRLNKPIGFMLLFWPCLWGLALAFNQNSNVNLFTNYAILFLLGSILMRSAGCIFNAAGVQRNAHVHATSCHSYKERKK